MANEEIHYYHSDSGVLPSASTDPWVVNGGGTRTVEDAGVRIVSAGGRASYQKRLFVTDTDASPARYADRFVVQAIVTGIAKFSALTADSPIGFTIDDGERQLDVRIGDKIEFVNPTTGAIVKEIKTGHAWLAPTAYRFVKDRSDQWLFYAGRELIGVLAYNLAPVSASTKLRCDWGHISVAGGSTSTAIYQSVEAGLNLDPPREWRVDRAQFNLLSSIQERWTDVARAGLRASVGLYESLSVRMEGAWRLLTAARKTILRFYAKGDLDPTTLNPAWTKNGAGAAHSIVRERLRISTSPAHALSYLEAAGFDTPSVDEEGYVRATVMCPTIVADVNGRAGPWLYMSYGDVEMTAMLLEVVAGESYGWAITTWSTAGAVTILGETAWRVDPAQPHVVEMQMLGQEWLLLIIDGQVVDRVAYADLTVIALAETASIGMFASSGTTDLEDIEAGRRHADLKRRPVFLQNAVERLIFVGGCERNDELETWMVNHHQVQERRGTTRGMIMELRRMTCSQDVFVVSDTEPGDWYLEETYPEVTPIFLEFGGSYFDIYVEFPVGASNFSPQELADLAVRYLVPVSTVELTYRACLATMTTGVHVVAGSTFRFPVKASDEFAVGDTVTIRNAANTASDTVVIAAIDVIPNSISLPDTIGVYLADSVIRKELATS